MKKRTMRSLGSVVLRAGFIICLALSASAQPNPATAGLAQQEKETCTANLKTLYAAIQAYERDHKDLPNWLSDLVPQYLPDTNVLICPVCRRTGATEKPPLGDPKLPSSYLYQFCPVPLGKSAPDAPTATRRDWKRLQMGLVGTIVPIVRCHHHTPMLNLAFDGKIYESPGMWEALLTNRVDLADLTAERMFAAASGAVRRFPARDPQAPPELLDLTAYYNAGLNQSWHGGSNNTLTALPDGLETFAGVDFDVRGIVQLRSRSRASASFPASIAGIPVHQKCERLHFLHAAGFGNPGDEGKMIGSYVVHFAANPMRLEIPIRYGHDVRNWHTQAGEPPAPEELKEAWRGQNSVSRRAGHSIRLFLTTWTNLAPDLEIASIDYASKMETPAPFLVAITAVAHHEIVAGKEPAAAQGAAAGGRAGVKGFETQQGRTLELSALILSGAALLAVAGVLIVLVWIVARRPRALGPTAPRLLSPAQEVGNAIPSSYTVVLDTQSGTGLPVPNPGAVSEILPVVHIDTVGATHTHAEILRRRAEAAADARAAEAARGGLAADLGRWLKQKLMRRLIADRADLLAAQDVAATKATIMEERLARVEQQLQLQNDGYLQRIEELTHQLLAAKEENRELIRAQIRQVKAEMEAARVRLLAQAENGK
jgi:hypothetical protein